MRSCSFQCLNKILFACFFRLDLLDYLRFPFFPFYGNAKLNGTDIIEYLKALRKLIVLSPKIPRLANLLLKHKFLVAYSFPFCI